MSKHTLTSYRALSDPIRNEGPWDLAGNPNKPFYIGRKGQRILLIGMHITAGIDDYSGADTSAESTNSWGRTATGASWHVCIDSDSIHPSLPDHYVAWVQGVKGYNFNRPGLGIEIGKRTTDWTKAPAEWVEKVLRNVAVWTAPRVIAYDIPLRVLTNRDEIQRLIVAGKPVGFAEHWTLTPETRSDAGRVGSRTTFPWARFFEILAEEIHYRKGTDPTRPRLGDRDSVTGLMIVADVQRLLNLRGYNLDEDGVFGELTDAAVRSFQRQHALEVDGIVGPLTMAALAAPVPSPKPPTPPQEEHMPVISPEDWRRMTTTAPYALYKDRLADDPETAPRIPLGQAVENATDATIETREEIAALRAELTEVKDQLAQILGYVSGV